MRIQSVCVIAACAWLLSGLMPSPAFAQGSSPPKPTDKDFIAVLDLEPSGVAKSMADAATDRLREELLSTGKYVLVERSQMDALLKEQAFQQTGCTSSECAVQAGKILGVRKLVSGRLTKLDDTHWVLTATLLDVETGENLRSATVQHQGEAFSMLDQGVRDLSARLTGVLAVSENQQAILQRAVETQKKQEAQRAGEEKKQAEYEKSPKTGVSVYMSYDDSSGTWKPAKGPSVAVAPSTLGAGADVQWVFVSPWSLRLFYYGSLAGGAGGDLDAHNIYTSLAETLYGVGVRYWIGRAWFELNIGDYHSHLSLNSSGQSTVSTALNEQGQRIGIGLGWEGYSGWFAMFEVDQTNTTMSGTFQNPSTLATSTDGTATVSGFTLGGGWRWK